MKRFLMFGIIFLLANLVLGYAQQAFDDIGALLTFTNVLAIFSLFTAPLTSLVKRWTGTEGKATVIVNALLNFLAKGVVMFVAGEATIGFAAAYTFLGFLIDQGLYFYNVQTAQKAVEKTLANNPDLPPSGVRANIP